VGPGILHLSDAPPFPETTETILREAYLAHRNNHEGRVADYIPALAGADPALFGIALVGVRGSVAAIGDARLPFSIQSLSKPFVYALVLDSVGPEAARAAVGVNATGMAFNSVMAVEMHDTRTMNPLVNAGAIATTSLVPGADTSARWDMIRSGLSAFAGRDLVIDDEVYASETATNERNRGIAYLLHGYGRLHDHPEATTDLYTRQCSLMIDAVDLATMGAVLANGGVNPRTRQRVVSRDTCRRVLAVLATAGLYERTGDWLFEIGLPGKSGVSGGIVTAAPGKVGLATYSPPLDAAGNSVRGQLATAHMSHRAGVDLFASDPAEPKPWPEPSPG